jgi:hypothetical protein
MKRGFDSLHPLSPARSSRATARQAPLGGCHHQPNLLKGRKRRAAGPPQRARRRTTLTYDAITFIFAFARSFLAGYSAAGPAGLLPPSTKLTQRAKASRRRAASAARRRTKLPYHALRLHSRVRCCARSFLYRLDRQSAAALAPTPGRRRFLRGEVPPLEAQNLPGIRTKSDGGSLRELSQIWLRSGIL